MKMHWRSGLPCLLVALTLSVSAARACTPAIPEPRLAGESDDAYRARIDTLYRERAENWLRERQSIGLRDANMIFIGRDTDWSPPLRRTTWHGRPIYVVPAFQFPAPSYFKPISWFRGPKIADLFQLRAGLSGCGLAGFGDTPDSNPGDLFVFFARKAPLTEDNLIDAIAVDSITDPALTAFVAKYRKARP